MSAPSGEGRDLKASVTVRIAGEEHTIRANAEAEYTKRCARFVDERIQEIKVKSGLIEVHKAAILAALSITDELFQAQEELTASRQDVSLGVQELTDRIHRHLDAAEGASAD